VLVSVIIPCYNQAHFLGEAIESVLAQSYPHFEVIVVDDGSTDATAEVAARYSGVHVIRQDNQGQAVARNSGAYQSRGSYLIFLDADDRLLPHALEAGLEHMNAHPECAFVFGRCNHIAADGSPLPTRGIESCPATEHYYVELLHAHFIATPALVMYRRAVFESVGGFDTSSSARGAEDWDLNLRIARKLPICYHDKVIAQYRLHNTSTSRNSASMLKATLYVLRRQRRHVKGNEQYERALKKGIKTSQEYYGTSLAYGVLVHVQEREWKQAFRDVLVLLRYYPQLFFRAYRKLAIILSCLSEHRLEEKRGTRKG